MYSRKPNWLSYGKEMPVILIIKPISVDEDDISNYFFEWNPDISRLAKSQHKW